MNARRESQRSIYDQRGVYVRKGGVVTCANGHPIFTFMRTILIGDLLSPDDMGDWQQTPPKIGQATTPVCAKCGAEWLFAGNIFGCADDWRDGRGQEANGMNDTDLVDQIEAIRRKNNGCWMALLRLALQYAPMPAKALLREITENDRKVSELMAKLAP